MIAVRAHAKINLGLKVQGRREDGYHEIRSTLQSIDLHDSLRLEEADGLTLRVEGDWRLPADASNLVLKAAEAFHAACSGRGARIVLTKRIPPGSGLGGGSSDAAATLMGLDRLWGVRAGPEKLFGVARTLGSDVPFFLYGGSDTSLIIGAFTMGFFGMGVWGMAPAYTNERFPTAVRGVGPGFCYHAGAAIGALMPWLLGAMQDRGFSAVNGMSATMVASAVVAMVMVWIGPETRGRNFND